MTNSPRRQIAFTLVELMLVTAIITILALIALPSYQSFLDRANIRHAIGDIKEIEMTLERYFVQHGVYPDGLDVIGMDTLEDPWGNPYGYFNHVAAKGKGKLRKDKALNPINSDYDLYSSGKDGDTLAALTAKISHDDVIRAGNGTYYGLAIDF